MYSLRLMDAQLMSLFAKDTRIKKSTLKDITMSRLAPILTRNTTALSDNPLLKLRAMAMANQACLRDPNHVQSHWKFQLKR